ncbi:uncharacterized protein EDB93DRAFT_1091222, partial [Suillus bovinus]|uniref:uncharacterized protein n=1 Tax=Suillus bovinus TaxID=48563 RepID=UPI001B8713C1
VVFIIVRKVVGSVSHSMAITCTIFRLVYRGWMSQLWWDDAWAALALIADGRIFLVGCLGHLSYYCPVVRITAHSVTFLADCFRAARMSIIFSIIPVANHSEHKIHAQITYLIAASFACMWAAADRPEDHCLCIPLLPHGRVGGTLAFDHITADVIADISLVAIPLYLLKNVGLSHSKKLLVQSAFGSSLLITAITITHSVLLISNFYSTITLMFAHLKVALSLIICNVLVIVTFLYRVCSKDTSDFNRSNGVFTTVIITPMSSSINALASLSLQEGSSSVQMKVQIEAMKLEDEDASVRCAEEGVGVE